MSAWARSGFWAVAWGLLGGGSLSAATITVTTTADILDAAGTAPAVTLASLPGPDGVVSLREAVSAANNTAGADTITFSVNGTFTLTGAANEDNGSSGDLDVKQSLTVQGNGVANTIVDGGGIERIFDFFPSAASVFELTNLTVQNGDTRTPSFKEGGAIYLHNNVTSTITDCRIINNFSGANGAIENRGNLTLTRCVISGNQTIPAAGNVVGGGLHNSNTLTITDCSFLNNSVRGEGGAIATTTAAATTVNIRSTTFSGNSASVTGGGNGNGGAISTTGNQGTITITNCTFSDNRADNNGGAASWVTPGGGTGNVTLSNVTISGNTADQDNSGAGTGGGFSITNASVTLHNTIVAKNYNSVTSVRDDIAGSVVASSSYNLIGDGTGANLVQGTNNNQVGSGASPIDPLLGALQNNGGLTQTMLLAAGSPAVDKGKALVSTDQRGQARPFDHGSVANAAGGDGTDIGAVEVAGADTLAPTLSSVALASNNAYSLIRARPGDVISLTFTASEPIQTPIVTLAGSAATVTNVGGNQWSATLTVGAGTALGPATFTINFTDLAGNAGTAVTATGDSSSALVSFPRPGSPEAEVMAESGSPAPGAGVGGLPADALLGTFGAPALSEMRDLVSKLTLHSGKKKLQGIYTVDYTGAEALPAFQGGAVPGPDGLPLAGLTFKSFVDPVISPDGAIAFAATVTGAKSTVDQGVWTDAFGSLTQVLQEGSDPPDLPAGAKLKSVTSLSLQDTSLVALIKLTAAKGIVASGKDDVVLLALTGVNTGKVLLRTNQAWNGSTIKTIATLAPALVSPGQGRWHTPGAVLAKITLASKEVQIVSVTLGGTITKVLSTLDAAMVIHADARWKSFAVPVMGATGGEFATSATLVGKLGGATSKDDVALVYSQTGATLEILARKGGLTPLSADPLQIRYATFFDPLANDLGQLGFLATLQGTAVKSSNKTVLFTGEPGNLEATARLGEPAPDADGNSTTALWSKFVSYALPGGEDSGVILLAETTGGDTPKKGKLGLWATDRDGDLRQVIRVGLPLVPGGPLVTSLTLLKSVPGVYGTPRSYDRDGSVAALVIFADKSQQLLRFDLP